MIDWDRQVKEWSSPPIDDVGYLSSAHLARNDDATLRDIIDRMRETRYTGWRNHDNLWRDVLGLDTLQGKDILDFGCGVGVEALELAKSNTVTLADISTDNLTLASKVLHIYGYEAPTYLLLRDWPFIDTDRTWDVFYCNGVLHHIPWPRAIMNRAHELLKPGGEVRLMVYSDQGWRKYIGTEPPDDTASDLNFMNFVHTFDQVGQYADWYNEEKIERWFGRWFTVERCEYLTDDQRYLGAILRRRDTA